MVASDVIPDAGNLLLMSMVLSIPVGLIVSYAVSKFPLKPVRDLIDGMDALVSGNFKTRVRVGRIMRRYSYFLLLPPVSIRWHRSWKTR